MNKTIKKIVRFCLYSSSITLSITIQCCEKKSTKNRIMRVTLSNIDTTEKCKKFINTKLENEIVIVQCKFCQNQEVGKLWIARYKAIHHRTIAHLICECNKRHNTSYAAVHCENCQ